MNDISSNLVRLDKWLDYCPFLSTVSNITILFQKYVLDGCAQGAVPNRYYQHIQDKSCLRCVILLIPIIGNVLVGLYDLIQGEDTPPPVRRPVDPQNALAVLQHAGPLVKDNERVVKEAVRHNGLALQYATDRVRNVHHVVSAAVQQNGLALEHAGDRVKDDERVVQEAVRQNGLALQYATPGVRDKYYVISAALT